MDTAKTDHPFSVGWLRAMSYLSTGFLAFAILAVSAVRLQGTWILGPVCCGSACLIVLALGTFRGMRWTLVGSMAVAMFMWIAALIMWWVDGARPPLVSLLIPPIVIAFNYSALHQSDEHARANRA